MSRHWGLEPPKIFGKNAISNKYVQRFLQEVATVDTAAEESCLLVVSFCLGKNNWSTVLGLIEHWEGQVNVERTG